MENFSDIRIYSVHYKPGRILKENGLYQPIMCGNILCDSREFPVRDNTGEHISDKNSYYSELSGVYWVWKNTNQQVTGICHYRRFYTAQPEPLLYQAKRLLYYVSRVANKRHGLIYTQNTRFFLSRILNHEELQVLLKNYDGILPQARKLRHTVKEHFKRYHDVKDLELLETIIREKYPEYVDAFDAVLQGKLLYANNMFILKDHHYQRFMEWWFDLLFEFEKRTGMEKYVGYQKRIMGFIAERLLTVWFKKNQLHCKELRLIYFKNLKYD